MNKVFRAIIILSFLFSAFFPCIVRCFDGKETNEFEREKAARDAAGPIRQTQDRRFRRQPDGGFRTA
jgi:hypothetical protein